jgi:hypothetical protein
MIAFLDDAPEDHGDMKPADAQRRSDPDVGARRSARARKILGQDPGASLITLAAFLAFVLSVVLWFTDSREEALFTGLWVPSILAVGAFYAALRRR